ncbi:MAG: hypothetical protein IOD12_10385 [Silvanigrellales bacterium]|nr:hypothetical protein [Silvanigrellales bacterium]
MTLPVESVCHRLWIVRLGTIFAPHANTFFSEVGAVKVTPIAEGLYLLEFSNPIELPAHPLAIFFRWHFPVHHRWPTTPSKTESFVEKAAQGLWKRFGSHSPKNLLVASLHEDPKSRALASNVRGRTLQVFGLSGVAPSAENSHPNSSLVLSLVGASGILAGLTTPRLAKSFHASGTRFLQRDTSTVVSRAGAKLVEGLDLLRLCGCKVGVSAHWLELGASPGGMTSELLERGFRVTALDRAALSERISRHPALVFHQQDVSSFQPQTRERFDALLCDMNGPWEASAQQVMRLAGVLRPESPIVFTLKFNSLSIPQEVVEVVAKLREQFVRAGCTPLLVTHASSNRSELSFLAQKNRPEA